MCLLKFDRLLPNLFEAARVIQGGKQCRQMIEPLECVISGIQAMIFLRSSCITEGKRTDDGFAEQPANTLPVYPLRL